MQGLDLALSLRNVHELAGQVLAELGIHRVNAVHPEIGDRIRIHVFTHRLSRLLEVGLGCTEADVLGPVGRVHVLPVLIADFILAVRRRSLLLSGLGLRFCRLFGSCLCFLATNLSLIAVVDVRHVDGAVDLLTDLDELGWLVLAMQPDAGVQRDGERRCRCLEKFHY